MIRTIVVPDNTTVQLSFPEDYVGREIEILYYPLDELKEEIKSSPPNTLAAFKGILSEKEVEALQQYVKQSRNEWDRDT